MKRLVLACAVVGLVSTLAAAKGPPDLTGAYTIKTGALPNKKAYVGKVELTKGTAAMTYNIAWATGAAGETKASGVALQHDKYVAAAFGGEVNIAGVYDGVGCDMNGDTNFFCGSSSNDNEGAGGIANHMFTPDAKAGFVGTFQVSNYDGETKLDQVTIAKAKGNVYTLTFTFQDGRKVSGVGISTDKQKLYWAAGKGGFGLALYKISGAALDGQWVMAGSTELGIEKLKK